MARVGFIQDQLDLKLLVLYIMARVASPITFLQLLELALCDAGVDYFSLTEVVGHLVDTGHLTLEEERYSITDKGRHNSRICESSLPFSVLIILFISVRFMIMSPLSFLIYLCLLFFSY